MYRLFIIEQVKILQILLHKLPHHTVLRLEDRPGEPRPAQVHFLIAVGIHQVRFLHDIRGAAKALLSVFPVGIPGCAEPPSPQPAQCLPVLTQKKRPAGI